MILTLTHINKNHLSFVAGEYIYDNSYAYYGKFIITS